MRWTFPVFMLVVASFYVGIAVAAYQQFKVIPKAVEVEKKHESPITIPVKTGPIKVMIIDTGIAKHPALEPYVQYDDSDDYKDTHGHGTHVAGIAVFGDHKVGSDGLVTDPLCKDLKVYSCKYYNPSADGQENLNGTLKCLQRAIDEKMDFINYSGGGIISSDREYELYKKFTEAGGIAVVAAGNEGANLDFFPYYPATYINDKKTEVYNPKIKKKEWKVTRPALENFYVATAVDRSGQLVKTSNHGAKVFKWFGKNVLSTLPNGQYGYMTGTSQSAPGVLHTILRQRCQQNLDLLHAGQ